MKYLSLFLTSAFLLSAFFFACTTPWTITGVPVLLSANFESDAINARPNLTLPGEPSGDQITDGGVGSGLKVIQDEGNKWLEMSNTREGRAGARLAFRANSITYPTKIFYSWKAKLMEGILNGSISINLTDGAGNENVQLRFEDSRIGGGGRDDFGYLYLMPSREFLGKLPLSVNCDFFVEINHAANTFDLTVTRPTSSDGTINILGHALSVNSTPGVKNPTIELFNRPDPPEFSGGAGSTALINPTSGRIWLDKMLIQGRN